MQIIQNTVDFKVEDRTVVAIGKFDGIHRGHQTLLEEMQKAKKEGLKTVIFTFVPSPASFFMGKECKELSTEEEKRKFFEEIEIDVLIEFPLNKETAAISATDFIQKILVKQLKVQRIVAGDDLSFGANGKGNCETLQKYALSYEYDIVILKKISLYGREISSTFIREEIEKGNIEIANELLGKIYQISGEMKHIEKKENESMKIVVETQEDKLLPPIGKYIGVLYCGHASEEIEVFIKKKDKSSKESINYIEIIIKNEIFPTQQNSIKIGLISNAIR